MALSQQEIELLIKLRSDAEKGFQALNRQVKEFTGEADKAAKGTERLKKKKDELRDSSQTAGIAVGVLAFAIGSTLKQAFTSSLDAASRMDSALIGLASVARGMKVDVNAAQEAAQKLASDGLMTVGEAAEALKNLLSTGFSLPEAIKLMDAFRDSAAFNRQGMLGFGEAVIRATQGVKFGNSALTDSTGLGKNLSVIMRDAGLSIDAAGRAAQDAGVRQAILNGFVKEGAVFQGDAAKYAETAAGKQAAFASSTEKASAAIGKSLQPAMSAFFSVASPALGLIEKFPGVFVALAGALTATVAPMVAMKVASGLGITSLGGLASTATKLTLALKADVLGSSAQRLGALSGASGGAALQLGRVQQAALIAGAAFAGWQIGRWIAQVFDLDTKIANLTARLVGFGDVSAEAAAAKQDVLNRAIANGAAQTITYAEAIQFNADKEAVRVATLTNAVSVQKAAIEAKIRLGELDKTEGDRLLAQFANEERRQSQAKARIDLATQIAAAEKKVRDEITSTGQTIPQLTASLAQNEEAFKKWADTNGLGEQTLKFLEEALKKSTDAKKKAQEETDKLRQQEEQLRATLQQLGIVTKVSVKTELEDLARILNQATKEGVDKRVVLQALIPRLEELATAARRSGIGVKETAAALKEAKTAGASLDEELRRLVPTVGVVAGIIGEIPGTLVAIPTAAEINMMMVRSSFEQMGIKTRAELEATARQAIYNYNQIRTSGLATPEEVKRAFEIASKAINDANGKIPSHWETTVRPGIIRQVETLQTAISGSFAQMLLGAKGFGEGFVDIWKSIKAAVLNVFNEIANAFIQGALKRILGALSGAQGGATGGFGGLLQSVLGIGGKGGGVPGLGGLPGLAGGGAALPGVNVGLPGAALPGGAAGGGIALSGLLGGLGAGAGGFGLGLLAQQLFGGAGLKSGALGAGGGAAQGALIGSIVPGIGTGIGALIGGLGGLFGGLLGKKEGQKVNDVRDQFLSLFGGGGTGEGSGFSEFAKQLNELGAAGDQLFQRVLSAKKMKDFESAVRDATTALDAHRLKQLENADAAKTSEEAQTAALENVKTEIDEGTRSWKEYAERGGVVGPKLKESFLEAMRAARDAGQEIDATIRELFDDPIVIPVRYNVEGAPGGGGEPGPEIPLPGAAAGVFATGPTFRVFGEKEPELGGPVGFMSRALQGAIERLGGSVGAGGGTPTEVFNFTINITALDNDGLEAGVERTMIPMITDAVRANRRQARTLLREALGVS